MWSSELSNRTEVAKGDLKLGTMAATSVFGAQASAGLCSSSSGASCYKLLHKLTGTRPFLADKCTGLWKGEIGIIGIDLSCTRLAKNVKQNSLLKKRLHRCRVSHKKANSNFSISTGTLWPNLFEKRGFSKFQRNLQSRAVK